MTIVIAATSRAGATRHGAWRFAASPGRVRMLLVLVIGAAIATAFLSTGAGASAQAVADAGSDLTRLLRFMAALKALMAVGAAAAILWRLGATVTLSWFAAYALGCGAMAAGPVLIWSMAHVGVGALLLHGGLLASVLLLWRDPMVTKRLAALVSQRRASRGRDKHRAGA